MGYIEELRELIGHKRINLCGSVAVIGNGAGRILLQHRTYPKGKWGLPGGLMELGESTEEAARREVMEETGLVLGKLNLLGIYSGPEYLCVAENGDEYYTVITAYWTDEFEGAPAVCDGESVALEWRDVSELPGNIARTHRQILDDYIAMKR